MTEDNIWTFSGFVSEYNNFVKLDIDSFLIHSASWFSPADTL